jgi:hypothetical protein
MEKMNDRIMMNRLFSRKDNFPIRVKLEDNNNPVDYILCKTGNEKLLLQKPFFNKKEIKV